MLFIHNQTINRQKLQLFNKIELNPKLKQYSREHQNSATPQTVVFQRFTEGVRVKILGSCKGVFEKHNSLLYRLKNQSFLRHESDSGGFYKPFRYTTFLQTKPENKGLLHVLNLVWNLIRKLIYNFLTKEIRNPSFYLENEKKDSLGGKPNFQSKKYFFRPYNFFVKQIQKFRKREFFDYITFSWIFPVYKLFVYFLDIKNYSQLFRYINFCGRFWILKFLDLVFDIKFFLHGFRYKSFSLSFSLSKFFAKLFCIEGFCELFRYIKFLVKKFDWERFTSRTKYTILLSKKSQLRGFSLGIWYRNSLPDELILVSNLHQNQEIKGLLGKLNNLSFLHEQSYRAFWRTEALRMG